MSKLQELFGKYKEERFKEVNQDYLADELNIIQTEMADGVEYYQKVISDIEIDRSNPNNSFIMYVYNKCDVIDNSSPTSFIKAKNALPDIDIDFPVSGREMVINYLSSKYGKDCVAQVVTFGTMKGRGALKEVLRITDKCDHLTANRITESIPDEVKVESQMKEMGEESLLLWTIKYCPTILNDYVRVNEEGNLVGDFADVFELAIQLEGCIKSHGKHAAAVIIGDEPLENVYPMIYDSNSDKPLCGMDFSLLEEQGALKCDILGVAALDKLMTVNNLLRYGTIHSPYEKELNTY